MTRQIPAVSADHLIAVNKQVVADYESDGPTDLVRSVVWALGTDISRQESLDVMSRMLALRNFLSRGEAREWLIKPDAGDYMLMDDALFQAAAVAPLHEAKKTADLVFDKATFLPLVLQFSATDGEA